MAEDGPEVNGPNRRSLGLGRATSQTNLASSSSARGKHFLPQGEKSKSKRKSGVSFSGIKKQIRKVRPTYLFSNEQIKKS